MLAWVEKKRKGETKACESVSHFVCALNWIKSPLVFANLDYHSVDRVFNLSWFSFDGIWDPSEHYKILMIKDGFVLLS